MADFYALSLHLLPNGRKASQNQSDKQKIRLDGKIVEQIGESKGAGSNSRHHAHSDGQQKQ